MTIQMAASGALSKGPGLNQGLLLPPKPDEPLETDCCGTGCTPCVFDLYEQELKLWETECERIKSGACSDAQDGEIISQDHYQKFELTDILKVTEDSYQFTFAIPGYQRLPLAIGQHLLLRIKTETKTLTRQYTPITDHKIRGKFEFVIKIYKNGEMTQLVKNWEIGDFIEWRGPFGNLVYKPNTYRRVVMLAAGTGIAPMVQVLHHILSDESENTWLHLVYACRDYSAILCKPLLDDWSGYWNFKVTYVLSDETTEAVTHKKRYGDEIICGRLTEELLLSQIGDDIEDIMVLICGTRSFDKDMINYLKHMGFIDANYHKF